jgi:hypothetical protein
MATTFRLSSSTPAGKVWFFAAGMAMALTGMVNLLNRRYGNAAFGLTATSIVANFALLCTAIVAGRITQVSTMAQILMAAVLLLTLILSAVRSARLATQ